MNKDEPPVAQVEERYEVSVPILAIEAVTINANCICTRWTVGNLDHLARVIAVIAMGQATHAAHIIAELLPAEPAYTSDALVSSAKRSLSVRGATRSQRDASRYHRDGLLFEAISWAAALQSTNGKALLRDPHVKSTTQGLDGLMIELDDLEPKIIRATIFEDKCSEDPRRVFRDEIMPAFCNYHQGKRANELLPAAAALLEKTGMRGASAIEAASRVLDKKYIAYRGCMATTPIDDSHRRRNRLFKDFEKLEGISANQRIGGVLVTGDNLRGWFDDLARCAIGFLDQLPIAEV